MIRKTRYRNIGKLAAGLLLTMTLFACKQRKTLFAEKKPADTGIHFVNTTIENQSLNLLTYPYIYNGAGVAVGDLDNDGWEDIFFVSNKKGGNKLYRNKGGFKFDDVTVKAAVQGSSDWSTGVSLVDINADGWLDIYVSTVTIAGQLQSANELYVNKKDGSFAEQAAAYGLDYKGHTTQSAFFDYDDDGDLDCYLLNHAVQYVDDYKDVASRQLRDSLSGDQLLRNDGGRFTNVTAAAGIYSSSIGYGLGIAVGDLNNDGWEDVYVSNDFKENDYCYINNGNGSFTEQSDSLFGHNSRFSMGNEMADYDNDGWADVMTLDMLSPDEKILKSSVADDDIGVQNFKHEYGFNYQYSKNCLQRNIGGRHFQNVALQKGVAATDWSWAPLFADFDNDGRKDLYISNGYKYRVNDLDFNVFAQGTIARNQQQSIATDKLALVRQIPPGQVPDYLYLQNSDGAFTDQSSAAGFTRPTLSNGAAYADLDKDGRLDLVVNRLDEPAGIFRNQLAAQNHLNIRLKGAGANTLGIGAKVTVFTKKGMQVYHQSLSRGFMSSVSPIIHIGLGDVTVADSVMVSWPGGKRQRLLQVKAGMLMVDEKAATPGGTQDIFKSDIAVGWQNSTAASGIGFVHREDAFNDMDAQPLLPHSMATQGPAIAVADVNKDGQEDFFVCGAKGQAGQLWLQDAVGKFRFSPQRSFTADSMYEQTAAIFFDADGDEDMDLLAVSGGNEWYGNNPLLNDRLYLNDGKGGFVLSDGLPALHENKSCAAACDFDKDGDMDVFIGGRTNARMYGYTPASVLLVNDGKGRFTEATEQYAKGLQYLGMITGAGWSDVDADGWQDLLVLGEWMPVTIFKNSKGKLEKQALESLAQTHGWWTGIYKNDLDGDGDDDFLLGNWGSNSKLTASEQAPLTLYLADWDENGDVDPVLSLYKQNGYYSFLGKSDLEKRLPYLKKKYLKYADIAGKTMNELFGKTEVDKARKLQANTLQSAVLWNDKGGFTLQALPSFLQTGPVFAFAQCGAGASGKTFVAGGNFFEVQPFEGRYDALMPVIFKVTPTRQIIAEGCLLEKGAIRSIQPVQSHHQPALLFAKNNDRLTLWTKNKN
jgi:enediyne biosynthesis protein E4